MGRRVEKPSEFIPALEWALASAKDNKLPVVLDVMIRARSRGAAHGAAGRGQRRISPLQERRVQMSEQYYPISVLVRNEPGVLARVAGPVRPPGLQHHQPGRWRDRRSPGQPAFTVVVEGDHHTVDQAAKQLRRLVSVIKVRDQSQQHRVERGLALIKVSATPEQRTQILQLVGRVPGPTWTTSTAAA